MIIGLCTIEIFIPGAASLKDKRRRLKPLLHQLRRRFEVAAAEVEHQDVWQSAVVAVVTVANEADHVYAVLDHAVRWVDENYRDVDVVDWQVELI
ncbi:MAG: DUF503 domain-containing protein [Anaerolineae bacterium]